MTNKEFYEDQIKPHLKDNDKPYNRQLYNDIKDGFHKMGLITEKQANNWCYPKNKYFK